VPDDRLAVDANLREDPSRPWPAVSATRSAISHKKNEGSWPATDCGSDNITSGAMRSSIGPCRVLQKRSIMLADAPLWPAVLKTLRMMSVSKP